MERIEMSIPIYCFNQSTSLKSSDMFLMINAINVMLPAFCTAWSLKQYTCVVAPPTTKLDANGMYCVFLDNSTSPGALAFHTENANVPYGEVFVKTILKYGGSILMGANNTVPTVAQAFAHEIFEMLVNPNVNVWWQTSNTTFVPAEVCDPVQGVIVPISVGAVTVGMSDYVLPEWCDPQSTKGPYNFLNTLTRPFQMSKGGYLVYMRAGTISYVYGETITPYIQYRSQNMLNFIASKFKNCVEPVAVAVAPVAPVAESVADEPVAPVAEPVADEPVAPVAEPVAPVSEEPVAPVAEPVSEEPVAPVAEPVAPVSEEPVAPVAEPVAEPSTQ